MAVDGFLGEGLVNSFLGGDDSTGTLTSPPFKIERPFLSFLIGGGNTREKLTLELLIDGKAIRSATGGNDRPGGSETLVRESWDVADLAGRTATLRVIDAAKGGWGHINVDQIVQTDTKPKGMLQNPRRELVAETRFLQIPIKNGAAKRVVTLLVDGEVVVRNDIELADGAADWWAPMEISAWKGKNLVLVVDKLLRKDQDIKPLIAEDSKHENWIGPVTFVLTVAIPVYLFAKAEMPTVQFYGILTGPGADNGDWTALAGGLSAAALYYVLFKLTNKK
jgi:hypothetical protein